MRDVERCVCSRLGELLLEVGLPNDVARSASERRSASGRRGFCLMIVGDRTVDHVRTVVAYSAISPSSLDEISHMIVLIVVEVDCARRGTRIVSVGIHGPRSVLPESRSNDCLSNAAGYCSCICSMRTCRS